MYMCVCIYIYICIYTHTPNYFGYQRVRDATKPNGPLLISTTGTRNYCTIRPPAPPPKLTAISDWNHHNHVTVLIDLASLWRAYKHKWQSPKKD